MGSFRKGLAVLSALLATAFAAACVSLPQSAAAEALRGQEATPGAPGLPDGRGYEEVTPTFKNGNFFDAPSEIVFGLASANGDDVVYPMSGPVGEATSGIITDYASRRTPGIGWSTVAATSRPLGEEEATVAYGPPLTMVPAANFESFLFTSRAPYNSEDPGDGVNIFLTRDPSVEAEWLGRPQAQFVTPALGAVNENGYTVAGASADLGRVFYAYDGTLTPEDATRAPHVTEEALGSRDVPWELYEWHEGRLVSAGELPDGSFNPYGAAPAAIAGDSEFFRKFPGQEATNHDNEVSEGGAVFFASPDPMASAVSDAIQCGGGSPCSSEAPELYVREPEAGGDAAHSTLVSASQLPGHEGEPAPDGVAIMPDASGGGGGTTAFATPDGSHVVFASEDQLTEAAPADGSVKVYEYDVSSGALRYLAGVTPQIAQVSANGSQVLFIDTASTPQQLSLWQAGSGGGSVSAIAGPASGSMAVSTSRIDSENSSVIFVTAAEIPSFNDAGSFSEVYRYEVASNELSCLSCPPHGIAPNGNAKMDNNENGGSNGRPLSTLEPRGTSADGSRVFFDTTAALVPRDTNGKRDVYEWEAGRLYLISSGTSVEESLYLDSDTSGENVFFATSAGLVSADTDEAYDVYDARIPRPGDNSPPTQVPCKGSVCQGPPSVPQLLGLPASETFAGSGNLTPASPAHKQPRARTGKRKKLRSALAACKRKERKRRAACKRNARRRYGSAAPRSRARHRRHATNRTRQHNRRGK